MTVAARDLPAGQVLGAADLVAVGFAPGSAPAGAVDVETTTGRTLAAPLRAGEPVTDVRLVGPGLTDGYPGLAAVPVRLPDAGMADLLQAGDRIDLVVGGPPRWWRRAWWPATSPCSPSLLGPRRSARRGWRAGSSSSACHPPTSPGSRTPRCAPSSRIAFAD